MNVVVQSVASYTDYSSNTSGGHELLAPKCSDIVYSP